MTSPLEQKIKVTGPVVITANRVDDGAVIFRRADGGWSTQLKRAAVATDTDSARALVTAAAADGLRAIGPYVAPVRLAVGGKIEPGNLRESIRLSGPTIALPEPQAERVALDA